MDQMKLDAAQALKDAGNRAFKDKHFNGAIEYYTNSLKINKDPLVLGNRAQAYINLEMFMYGQMDCTEAILLDPTISKNFYRRAAALKSLGIYEEAAKDLRKCIELTPNQAAQAMLQEIEKGRNPKIIEMFTVDRDESISSTDEFIDVEISCRDIPDAGPSISEKENMEKVAKKLPKVPANFGEFTTAMNYLDSDRMLIAEYFLQIDENRFHFLFDELINDKQVGQILYGLSFFIKTCPQSASMIATKLIKLSEVTRFDMIVIVMGMRDKRCIYEIANWCSEADSEMLVARYAS